MKTIAAIGGGITGVTTAYALAKCGDRVTVTERHRYAGMETSFANGGQLDSTGDIHKFTAGVVCAGTAIREFAALRGYRINIYPVKGYSITVNLNDEQSRALAPTASLLDDVTKLVTSQPGDDRFRFAGTAEFDGFNPDTRADRNRPLVDMVQQARPSALH